MRFSNYKELSIWWRRKCSLQSFWKTNNWLMLKLRQKLILQNHRKVYFDLKQTIVLYILKHLYVFLKLDRLSKTTSKTQLLSNISDTLHCFSNNWTFLMRLLLSRSTCSNTKFDNWPTSDIYYFIKTLQEEFSNLKQPVWSFFKEGTEVVRDVERFLKFHFQRDSRVLQNMWVLCT